MLKVAIGMTGIQSHKSADSPASCPGRFSIFLDHGPTPGQEANQITILLKTHR